VTTTNALEAEVLVQRPGDDELAALVKELDEILDDWFLADVAPALEDASRARAGASAQSPAA
jgi:hypothetical protein